ncbi:hypothetical protein EDB81DRAFT_901898 [Dactylonectria macrodidyma]|uniref:FAD-binding domain-containing protein n=1 Tax=Dactylonectria macrodidyma TaxID=307937 RepID=A0A9P9EF02_9HYPO|nr:hypothetical protein EDB81DRAFT_901898 [Dactylonectria macrodidyma]
METTEVIIVGAGPSGLALAIALGIQKVKSIVLEKNYEICEDPRAIAITGDTARILNVLGINLSKSNKIGQVMPSAHFHRNSFNSKPFLSIDYERDWLEQSLAPATVLFQPELEKELRALVKASEYAELRLESTVTSICEVSNGVQVTYSSNKGSLIEVQGRYLVGADGKRGYVRKEYLESRGIKQQPGLYKYDANWIAANLAISLPTPTSHPSFPLWKLGYQPEDLWDLFWPGGFHFCSLSAMPVAAGRFGPKHEKYWRFEYELPPKFLPDDPHKHLEEQMKVHMTIPGKQLSRKGTQLSESVCFPWDCVKILRCGPAYFSQRVVNRWFHENVILIGDAAHVFPPFGAQGIASGLRDTLGLAWRLAILCSPHLCTQNPARRDALLQGWSRERRKGVDDSSMLTAGNGDILLSKSYLLAGILNITSGALEYLPRFRDWLVNRHVDDKNGYRGVDEGLFMEKQGGGIKTAQVCVKTADGLCQLSDEVFKGHGGFLTLLLLGQSSEKEVSALMEALTDAKLPLYLLSDEVVELCDGNAAGSSKSPAASKTKKLYLGTPEDTVRMTGEPLVPLYNPSPFRGRFQSSTRFALIRPDLIVFSQAQRLEQLMLQLRTALDMIERT